MQFNKPYNRSEYIQFLKGFLTQSAVFNQKKLDIDKEKYSYLSSVTELAVDDSLGLVVYEIAHTSRRDARIGITSNAFKLLDSEFMQNALVIFYNENNVDNYRLSLITMNYKIVGNKLVREQSNPKRFSYLLGKGIGVHTPETFLSKGRISDNKDLLQRFSVEVLTKEFYEELSDWYAWALISDDVRFPSASSFVPDDVRKKEKAQNLIRLLTRLLFVWFLKQKNLIPDEIFDEDYIRENLLKNFYPEKIDEYDLFAKDSGTSYYKAILQNLFFATLNCPIIKEGTNELQRGFRVIGQHEDVNYLMRYKDLFKNPNLFLQLMNEKVPFLNGGLFDCLDRKYENPPVYIDGFSDTTDNCPVIPDYMFFSDGEIMNLKDYYEISRKSSTNVIGLIDLLKKYNFTVEENTPVDIQVSLDPELLGKVFENLLASYNPETGSTARKATGSYYTPRTVVQFMVTESLVQYISSKVPGVNKEDLYELISYTPSKVVDFSYSIKLKIIKALFECKILDPACGSGAFPMGVLQQMVHVLSILDPNNVEWKSIVIASVNQETLSINAIDGYDEKESRMKDLLETFEESLKMPDYARKLYLIENCIYGVDIQPIATQISHLRFFISLVVEQEPNNNNLTNFGIRPLPNLEAKFVAGNTLLKIKKIDDSLPLFRDSNIADKQSKLKDASHKLFRAKTSKTKRKYRDLIKELRSEISFLLNKDGAIGNEDASLLAKWDMFNQNEAACFFDPEWMFDVSDGFDIIIGNPPYIQLQKNEGELAKLYKNEGFTAFDGNGDVYCLFYEQGIKLLKKGGILSFITSNKWMRAGYGESLRAFLSENSNPLILLDCGGNKIFESANVDVNIILTEKNQNQGKTLATVLTKDGSNNMSNFIKQNITRSNFATSNSWIILSPIETQIKNKIEKNGVPLKKWDILIYRGILTGCNEAFIISTEQKDIILNHCTSSDELQRTAKLIRPVLRGRDIGRNSFTWNNLWIIALLPSRHYAINQYPSVEKYLLTFGKERLVQEGKKFLVSGKEVKSRKKTNNKWFETQDSISYWEDFYKPKIIYPCIMSSEPRFALDDKGEFFTFAPGNIIIGEKKILKYLNYCLNSKLYYFALRKFYMGGGIEGELKTNRLEILPILPIAQFDTSLDYTNFETFELELEKVLNLSIEEIAFINKWYCKNLR